MNGKRDFTATAVFLTSGTPFEENSPTFARDGAVRDGLPPPLRNGRPGIFRLRGEIALLLLIVCHFFPACSIRATPADRYATADMIAQRAGWEKSYLPTKNFTLTAYRRGARPGAPLNLYIEGDGAAWIDRSWRSDDPTPKDPLVLELAVQDPGANVAYLARPGQYVAAGTPRGDPAYWSHRRFSPEVVAALGEAADILKVKSGAEKINLVGYSGGAALAVLLAAERDDILSLRTVAGNLDPAAVNRRHQVDPPAGSLDPLAAAEKIKGLPQRHFVGADDAVVPPVAARNFLARQGGDRRRLVVVPRAGHSRGWRERWRALSAYPLF